MGQVRRSGLRLIRWMALGMVLVGCAGCPQRNRTQAEQRKSPTKPEARGRRCVPAIAGSDTPTARIVIQPRLGEPLNGLTPRQLARFKAGRAAFRKVFKEEDGLGPAHNLFSCAVCHVNPIGGSGTITVTLFGHAGPDGFDPLKELGGPLLQGESIHERCKEHVPREANVVITRITPSALGAGLIEAIPDEAIKMHAQEPPIGISGRVHWVHPIEDPPGSVLRAGRFGWKSQMATVRTFSAAAARNELGLTNQLIPVDAAPNGDADLLRACDTVADPEDKPDAEGFTFIDRVTDFQRFLAPPPQTPRSGMAGEEVFDRIGCADCHTPSFRTRDDAEVEEPLRNKLIKPYSDFLLHDMGSLGDGFVTGDAQAREMRTTPLWGFRIRFPVLHDGRVSGSTLTQRATRSILAHAGEAAESIRQFQALSSKDKERLMAFLDSLGRVEFDDDGDNDVDHDDYRTFERCFAGGRRTRYTPDDRCSLFDIDRDGDVDIVDHAAFQRAVTGPLYGSTMVVP